MLLSSVTALPTVTIARKLLQFAIFHGHVIFVGMICVTSATEKGTSTLDFTRVATVGVSMLVDMRELSFLFPQLFIHF